MKLLVFGELISLSYDFVRGTNLHTFIRNNDDFGICYVQFLKKKEWINKTYDVDEQSCYFIINVINLYNEYYNNNNTKHFKYRMKNVILGNTEDVMKCNLSDFTNFNFRYKTMITILYFIRADVNYMSEEEDWKEGLTWLLKRINRFNIDTSISKKNLFISSLSRHLSYQKVHCFNTRKLKRQKLISDVIRENLRRGIISPLRFIHVTS